MFYCKKLKNEIQGVQFSFKFSKPTSFYHANLQTIISHSLIFGHIKSHRNEKTNHAFQNKQKSRRDGTCIIYFSRSISVYFSLCVFATLREIIISRKDAKTQSLST